MHSMSAAVATVATESAHGSDDAAGSGLLSETVEREVSSLRAVFRERRISLTTMDRPLRWATGGALASLLGVALLIALRDVPASNVVLGRSSGQVVQVSAPLFIATLALLALGLAYLVTGAILASWPVALITLGLITAIVGLQAGAFGSGIGEVSFLGLLPGWARWTSRALLAGIWLVAAAAWGLGSPHRGAGTPSAAAGGTGRLLHHLRRLFRSAANRLTDSRRARPVPRRHRPGDGRHRHARTSGAVRRRRRFRRMGRSAGRAG
jgi:hypothetical protein